VSVELVYEELGRADGPVLVLANSLGSTPEMWDRVTPALAERARVIRFDHRGHGRSPVPPGPYEIADLGVDVLALLDRLGLERVHWCGLSLGAMVGMWLGANAPERIDRLVLCCTSAQLGPPEMWAQRAAAVREGGMEAVADAGIDRWLSPAFREREPEVAAEVRAMLVSAPPEGYANSCGVIERMNLVPQLGSITAPTLVIGGDDDPSTPPEHVERIASNIPGARLEMLHGARHLAAVEQPQQVAALVAEHLFG
jgi:3-oxoadipate enol-lactonase